MTLKDLKYYLLSLYNRPTASKPLLCLLTNKLLLTLLVSFLYLNVYSRSSAQINIEDVKTVNNVDVDYVMAWKSGVFRFDNTDLRTIMKQMSRWFDIDIEFETIANPSYTGLLPRNIPASKLFEVLEETGGVHFKTQGKRVIVMH